MNEKSNSIEINTSSIINTTNRLSEVKETLLSHYKANHSKNTYLSYINSFINFIRIIGDKNIALVSKTDLEDFKIIRSREVNLVSTNIDIRNIKAIFNKMAELDMIEYSKLSGVKQFKIETKKVLSIDTADIVNILNTTKDTQMRQIIRFTLLTASRISEVLIIKMKDIDFEKGIINIYQQKTNCYKTIPLTSRLTELVNEIIQSDNQINTKSLKESYLFYNKFKNDPFSKLRADTVSKNFKKILRQLNLSSDFKFHSLRHSTITELIMNNVPLNVVKEIAGHKSISTTMGYSHVKSEDMRQAVNSLSY
ncbi:MAG: tyrosine-type recombinase/integrase [Ignavibacteria bacterium]|nr:tyrosine-type recombinase/integrase [Ignavibacteria bacterium]